MRRIRYVQIPSAIDCQANRRTRRIMRRTAFQRNPFFPLGLHDRTDRKFLGWFIRL